MLGVTSPQRQPHASRGGAELLQGDAGRGQLVAIRGIDVAIPELRREPRRPARSKMMSVSARASPGGGTTAGRS